MITDITVDMDIDFGTVALTNISDPYVLLEIMGIGGRVEVGPWWIIDGNTLQTGKVRDYGPATLRLSLGEPDPSALSGWEKLGEEVVPLGPGVYAASTSTEGYVPTPLASLDGRRDFLVHQYGRVEGETADYWVFATPADEAAR